MKNIIFALLSISIIACSSTDPQHIEQEALWDQMMVVHDEVMPEMGKIRKTSKKLKNYLEENATTLEPELQDKLKKAQKYLDESGEGMMDWMSQIGDKKPRKLRDENTHEKIVQILNAEIVKITKVKEDMLTSIKEGEALIKSLSL